MGDYFATAHLPLGHPQHCLQGVGGSTARLSDIPMGDFFARTGLELLCLSTHLLRLLLPTATTCDHPFDPARPPLCNLRQRFSYFPA